VEFQFHPASGSGAVRTLVLGERGEKAAVLLAGAAAGIALSLWVTVPAVAWRALRDETSAEAARDYAEAAEGFRAVEARVAGMADRARDAAGLLSRIAFLYGVDPSVWPRALNPEAGLLPGSSQGRAAEGLRPFLAALESGREILAGIEAGDPAIASRTPSILPLGGEIFEPLVVFGPRVSPWTGAEEFFRGIELAAPTGTAVLAPADGTVAFAGRVPPKVDARLWRNGNLVVLVHGKGPASQAPQATVFGHLARIDARRGQRVAKGERIGTVGATGWTVSPSLHYELWRLRDGRLAPTDPRFAILDRRLGPPDPSLEKMVATSVPGSVEPLPIR
jgi:murein DD-endopeptidase MepM/ murein hydrolase activator NlpD